MNWQGTCRFTCRMDRRPPHIRGGPWFRGIKAFGIMRSQAPDGADGVYMAINYISDLDVTVLTN